MAAVEDIETATVLVADDVASAPAERASDRRGVAGMVLAWKCAGAAAERGDSLGQVADVARHALGNIRSMGVGLSPTIIPAAGRPTFELAEGEMELGIGIHGEPGVRRAALETADAIADEIMAAILADLWLTRGDRVVVMVNGLGATPLEELYILFRRVKATLDSLGIVIHRPFVGEFATSLEMAGASITLMRLDDRLIELIDAPAHSPFFRV
jgi:dihydroxyacetone kinase